MRRNERADVVPRQMLELCRDLLRASLATNLELKADIARLEAEVARLKAQAEQGPEQGHGKP